MRDSSQATQVFFILRLSLGQAEDHSSIEDDDETISFAARSSKGQSQLITRDRFQPRFFKAFRR